MAYLYVIHDENDTMIPETWSTRESVYQGADSAWNKFCDMFNFAPEPDISPSTHSPRQMFVVMSGRAGNRCRKYGIPDEVLYKAIGKQVPPK